MRIAYVVSRFPVAPETFILRELNELDRDPRLELELLVLFPAKEPFVHPDAAPWVRRARRAGALRAAYALAWWLRHSPRAILVCAGRLARAYARRPALLVRALATVPLAAAHARDITAAGVSHVHAHFATYPAICAWICSRLTGVRYSFTAHAHDIFIDQSHLSALVLEAAFVVAISEFNRAFLAPYGAGSVTPVHVVRCGVAPSAYSFRPREVPASGIVRGLCVASLQEYKGHRVLLEALATGGELARVHIELVGTGPLEPELRALAGRLGLAERVRFLGMRSEVEVARLLDACDVFVLPSLVASSGQMDGIPVALMEALAAGIPVVATRLSGIPELVRDGITGLLAEPGDPAALAGALRRLLADPRGARDRAHAGRELVEREFDVRRSAELLGRLFRDARD